MRKAMSPARLAALPRPKNPARTQRQEDRQQR